MTQTDMGTSLYLGGSFKCEKGSRNPCGFADTRITAGWTGDGEVGWLWSAAQAGGYPFPHVQGARFKTSDLSLIDEPVIWDEDFAWMYPSAGVNARGDVGVILYRLCGSEHPRPRAFVVDDVSGWSSISTVGSAYTAASSTTQEPRFVWFGRERDGCADLVVSAFGFLYSSSSNLLTLADTTWNTGGIEAAASKTRFYLSRDTAADSGDTLLDAIHEVPALDDADSDPELLFTSVPEGTRAGMYYVIACADQPESIDEVSDSNNCLVEPDTLTVKAKFTLTRPAVTITGPKKPGATTAPGRTPPRPGRTITRPATTTIERPARPPVRQGPSVTTTAQG